jgi:hypothetical protein
VSVQNLIHAEDVRGRFELGQNSVFKEQQDATSPTSRLFGHVARIPLSVCELAIIHSLRANWGKLIFSNQP